MAPKMDPRDDVDRVLELGEVAVAQALLDTQLKALKKQAKAKPTSLVPLLRRRAILAEESSIDDDLPSLALAAKQMAEAAMHPDADDADRVRLGWGLLMANSTVKARKWVDGNEMLEAGLAYAKKPGEAQRKALFAASKAHPERAVRLVVQRSEPAAEEAKRLFESRRKKAPLPDRHTLRALRLAVAALRVVGDPEAAELAKLDPEYGLEPLARLELRKDRLLKIETMFGADSPLLLQPYYSLSSAAKSANALDLAISARLRVDALLAKRRGQEAAVDRSALLIGVRRDLLALGRIDEAAAIVAREEQLQGQRGLDVPYHTARAEICEARGDWNGCLEEWRHAVVQARESKHPAYGPGSTNLRLTEGWLAQAEARASKAGGKR